MRSMFIDTLVSNLQIHSNQGDTDIWLQIPVDGLEAPEYRTNIYERPGEDGGIVSSMFYATRPVTLRGMIKGASPAIYEANRQKFAAATAIQRDSSGYPVAKRIQFTTLAGNVYFFDAYFERPIYAQENVNNTHFLLNMKVPNPQIFGATVVDSGAVARASGGGFILPVILPIVSTGQTGGSVLMVNAGNANSYPILKLTGPLTNPFIQNTAVNKTMQLNYTIPAGSVVTIDMLNKTIMLNGTSSILSVKTSDSEWWGIVPGNNNINFATNTSADTGNLDITFFNAYLGV